MPTVSNYKTEPATLGEAMLRALPGTVAKIAATLGLRSPQSVQWWRHGIKLPGPLSRDRMAAMYGIPVDAWLRSPTEPAPLEPPPVPVAAARAAVAAVADAELGEGTPDRSSLAGVQVLLREVRHRRAQIIAGDGRPMDYFRSIRTEMDLLRQVAQFEAIAEAADDRIIRTNPRWLKIRNGLADILAGYPEIADRVAGYLESLDV